MTMREEFEAWFEPEGLLLSRVISDERYESMTTEWAYMAWKASRAAALEEAAKLCDGKASEYDLDFEPRMNIAAERCAVGIRALKDAP